MALTMQHWNERPMLAVAIETTGDDPGEHEMFALSIVPVDSNLNRRRDVIPLDILIRPTPLGEVVPLAIREKQDRYQTALLHGIDPAQVSSIIEYWMLHKLKLPLNRKGTSIVIPIILTYDWHIIKPFLHNVCFHEVMKTFFGNDVRDLRTIMTFMNDRAGLRAELVPYSKTILRWLLYKTGVRESLGNNFTAAPSLEIADQIRQAYQELCKARWTTLAEAQSVADSDCSADE